MKISKLDQTLLVVSKGAWPIVLSVFLSVATVAVANAVLGAEATQLRRTWVMSFYFVAAGWPVFFLLRAVRATYDQEAGTVVVRGLIATVSGLIFLVAGSVVVALT